MSYSNLDNLLGDDNIANSSIFNKGIGVDIGLLIHYSKLGLSLKVENIKSSKSWNLNLYSESNSYDENIPMLLKVGTHYFMLDNMLKFYLAGDSSMNKFSFNKIGLQIGRKKSSFKIKLGISNSSSLSPTLGFNYSNKIGENIPFKLGYGIAFGSVQDGMSHIFTWTFTR